ncbi:hypothetical protein HLB44_09615 [Aquincola sp. S2]|uniref:Uncharacterized protein n=1 Tax=Pseudaquabacterium terrae TaxID=2732868 RepID=A0ABX2EF57_9BURK|nr:hypothetical protein [Aquabacterium terrae]NRF67239.1 hypothetical protein [Aquabacterium terrae]
MTALLSEPRWAPAAQALVDGCTDLRDDEDRVALLAAVCEGLGDELYPAFLRVLWTVGQHGDHAACAAIARALVHALRTGRLPSGRRSAWGDSAPTPAQSAFGRVRCLGPLEYLCAWHAQADPVRALSSAQFHLAARALMDLVGASAEARALYCEKLLADADDPLPGALTRQTREALRALATAWGQGAPSFEACARFLQALPGALTRPLPPALSRLPTHFA